MDIGLASYALPIKASPCQFFRCAQTSLPPPGKGTPRCLRPLFHQLVMTDLIVPALLKRRKAANPRLMLNPLFRAHQFPASGIRLARPPRASRRGRAGEQQADN
jgi:hypothetical protein